MPCWICNPCTWNPHERMQSELLQTKYMVRMCWELAVQLVGAAREGGGEWSTFVFLLLCMILRVL